MAPSLAHIGSDGRSLQCGKRHTASSPALGLLNNASQLTTSLFTLSDEPLQTASRYARRNVMAATSENAKRWSHKVKTASTFPPEGIFTKDAQTIAKSLGSKKVSPKGIGSGIRMIQFFINRARKNLPMRRKQELEKAKESFKR
jgi:hypothetical protein